jgi:hypothetical protein
MCEKPARYSIRPIPETHRSTFTLSWNARQTGPWGHREGGYFVPADRNERGVEYDKGCAGAIDTGLSRPQRPG